MMDGEVHRGTAEEQTDPETWGGKSEKLDRQTDREDREKGTHREIEILSDRQRD